MEKTAFILYLFAAVFGVLFFGAIHAWVYTPVLLAIFAASLLLLPGLVTRHKPEKLGTVPHFSGNRGPEPLNKLGTVPHLFVRWVPSDLTPLFLIFLALPLLQLLPLPPGLLGFLSPDAKIAHEAAKPAAALLGDPAAGRGAWGALAPYAFPVRMSLIRWAAYGLFFFGLLRCLHSRRRIETAVLVLLALGSFDALYGILQTYSNSPHILWFKNDYPKDLSGTYLNRNHFANLMMMTVLLAVAYAAGKGGAPGEAVRHDPRRPTLKRRFLALFTENTRRLKRFLVVFAGSIMALGLIRSASRGGIISATAALLLMGLAFWFRQGQRRHGRVILLLCGIALIFALHAGLDYTLGRFSFFDQDLQSRWVRAARTFALFADHPLAGVGMGNFRHAYGRYQSPQDKNLYVDYAHNDYAQFLADAGILGGLGLLAGLGWFVWRTLRRWGARHDPFAVALGIAPFAAALGVAIHALSEYNLRRPANVLVLLALTAIGCAALRLETRRAGGGTAGTGGTGPAGARPAGPGMEAAAAADAGTGTAAASAAAHAPAPPPPKPAAPAVRRIPLRPWGAAILAAAAGGILWCGYGTVRHFAAEIACSSEANITLARDPNPPAGRVRRAIARDGGNAVYHAKLAQALMNVRDKRMQGPLWDRAGWVRSHGPICEAWEEAIRRNPWNAEYHVRLGWEYSYREDHRDHTDKWLRAADLCFDRAAWFGGFWPQNPRLQYDMGNYWAMRAGGLRWEDPWREVAWTKALWHYQQGMLLEGKKGLPPEIANYLRGVYRDGEILFRHFWLPPTGAAEAIAPLFHSLKK